MEKPSNVIPFSRGVEKKEGQEQRVLERAESTIVWAMETRKMLEGWITGAREVGDDAWANLYEIELENLDLQIDELKLIPR